MRNLLALVGLATVTFIGFGWYLGWYKLEKNPSSTSNTHLQIGVDTKKVAQDVQRGVKGITELFNSLGSQETSQQSWYDPTPAPAPKAPPVNANHSWYDPTPVPPANPKPSPGWRLISPNKR